MYLTETQLQYRTKRIRKTNFCTPSIDMITDAWGIPLIVEENEKTAERNIF